MYVVPDAPHVPVVVSVPVQLPPMKLFTSTAVAASSAPTTATLLEDELQPETASVVQSPTAPLVVRGSGIPVDTTVAAMSPSRVPS